MTPEPTPVFRVLSDCVVWEANGLRIKHAGQFANLGDIFARASWWDHFDALHRAELALSDPTRSTIAGE